MRVRMLDTKRQFESLRGPILEAVERVLSSGAWIGGPEVKALEEELAPRLGTRHAVAVASGTDALLLSLKALGVGPGVDVVLPTFTFFATAGAVVNAGGRPGFADIKPGGWNLVPLSLARVRTPIFPLIIEKIRYLVGKCVTKGTIRNKVYFVI